MILRFRKIGKYSDAWEIERKLILMVVESNVFISNFRLKSQINHA